MSEKMKWATKSLVSEHRLPEESLQKRCWWKDHQTITCPQDQSCCQSCSSCKKSVKAAAPKKAPAKKAPAKEIIENNWTICKICYNPHLSKNTVWYASNEASWRKSVIKVLSLAKAIIEEYDQLHLNMRRSQQWRLVSMPTKIVVERNVISASSDLSVSMLQSVLGLTYSSHQQHVHEARSLNRKVLSNLAISNPSIFADVVKFVNKYLCHLKRLHSDKYAQHLNR